MDKVKMIDLKKHLLNKPLLMSNETAEGYMAFAPESFQIEDHQIDLTDMMYNWTFNGSSQRKPYRLAEGVAIIPITGTLLHRFSYSYEGATGYDYVKALFDVALSDPDVKGIVFDINSGGGQVSGAFDLADHIYNNRSVKPTLSIVDEHAYSAAYLIGSSAERMVVPKTGGVGSIGVVSMHVDISRLLSDIGYKITFIQAGKHKTDGNMYQELPESVRKRFQASVDESYEMFIGAVSRNRGLDSDIIRQTEAQCFGAKEAYDIGLVDDMSSASEAFSSFIAELNGESRNQEADKMASTTNPVKSKADQSVSANSDEVVTFTQHDIDAAKDDGFSEGRQMERDRFAAVMESEHFDGNKELAAKMLNTDLTAEQIIDMLSVQPTKRSSGTNAFHEAMESTGNPEVGAEDASVSDDSGELSTVLKDLQLATGIKLTEH